MSAKKLVVVAAGVLAIAGGAYWIGTRGPAGRSDAAIVARPAAAPASTGSASAAPSMPKPHVERVDKGQRDRLLAQIREAHAHTAASPSNPTSSVTRERPALPEGELDKQYIRAAVKEIIPLVTECYDEGLHRDPKLEGKVVVDFTIEGEPGVGGVIGESAINTTQTEIQDATMRECIQETMYALQIDPPSNGGVVKVSYPFLFRSSPP